MAVRTYNNAKVFLIDEDGVFVPVATQEHAEIDVADFADGVWGVFRNSDGMVNRLSGNLDIWDGGDKESRLDETSFELWYSMGGSPSSLAGTYVVIGLFYYSPHQSGVSLGIDDTIAGDGYVAITGEYSALDADREVLWAFSDFDPISPEPPSEFWTNFVGSHEVP